MDSMKICEDCGSRDDIVAHHVFSFSEFPSLRYDTDNGITLCRTCHKVRHSEVGFKKQEVLI
jgi:5-methylcytosine-specific restriction endonuclease McrA